MSTHWSTHQTPRLLHFKFQLDPLKYPQRSRHFVDPAFRLMRFPLDGELDFYFEKLIFILIKKNDLESPLIFVLFLKGKQNKKENTKCDSLFIYYNIEISIYKSL